MVIEVKDLVYEKYNLVISKSYLNLRGVNISFNAIESVRVMLLPKKKIFTFLKPWLIGFLIVGFLFERYTLSTIMTILGDLYILSGPCILIYNIYMFFQKYYAIIIKTVSGEEHKIISKDKLLLDKIKNDINNRKKLYEETHNSNILINNGIISKGNNNKNKIIKEDKNDYK